MKAIISLISILFLVGCASGPKPLKGGQASHKSPAGAETHITTTENPKQASTTVNESESEVTRVIPKGSVIREVLAAATKVAYENSAPVNKKQVTNSQPAIREITLAGDMQEVTKVKDSSRVSLGAAQHDDSRKLAAGYMSVRWIQGLGALLAVAGCCFAFIPYLRLLTGKTFGMILGGVGLAIIFLAHAVVGNETLVILCVFGGLGAYFFIHQYGKKSGETQALKDFIDKNKDGIDDRSQ